MYLREIRSRPTAYSKVTVQHNYLNGKNVIQNKKYKFKNNIKLLIADLAMPHSALRTPTLFPLSHLETISFLMSKLIRFLSLFCWLTTKSI
jgi:hypothetical protein